MSLKYLYVKVLIFIACIYKIQRCYITLSFIIFLKLAILSVLFTDCNITFSDGCVLFQLSLKQLISYFCYGYLDDTH